MLDDLNFTLRQLRYFMVVAEELHVGRAAQRLNVSQPPVSVTIRQLEEELGVQLFERNSKGVCLTPAGADFAARVGRALGQLREAREHVQLIEQGAVGSIRVGFVPSMIFRGLLKCIERFRSNHPQIDIELVELNSARQLALLESRGIDAGFVHATPMPDAVSSLRLLDERFVCCVPMDHRLALRKRIALRELAGEKVIVFSRSYASHYHDRIVGILRAANVEPYLGHEVSHWFTILALAGEGMGVSLVPQSLVRLRTPGVAFVEITDKDAQHGVEFAWRPADQTSIQKILLHQVAAFYRGFMNGAEP